MKWEGDLRRITSPGVFSELWLFVQDGEANKDDSLTYPELARTFCDRNFPETVPEIMTYFDPIIEANCEMFVRLDSAGWYYVL
jgi:hypothetical protein